MTPEEKAKSLLDMFYGIRCLPDDHRYDQEPTCHHQAKECAIICVEQIIEGIESVIGDQKHMWREGEKEQHKYYTKVLEHIKTHK